MYRTFAHAQKLIPPLIKLVFSLQNKMCKQTVFWNFDFIPSRSCIHVYYIFHSANVCTCFNI